MGFVQTVNVDSFAFDAQYNTQLQMQQGGTARTAEGTGKKRRRRRRRRRPKREREICDDE